MLNIAVLGTGRIGKIHLKNLLAHKDVKVCALADPFIDEQWAKSLNIKNYYKQISQIYEDKSIDAVFICTPSNTHYALIKEAIKHKKAIFCEKPVDLDLNKILEIKNLIKENSIFFQVGFNRRFDSNFKKIALAVEDNKIGKLISTKIISRDPQVPNIDYIKSSGGIFLDMTIHDFDILRFITKKEVKEVWVNAGNFVSSYGDIDIDTAMIHLTLEDNSFALIENCRETSYGYDQRVEIFGSSAKAQFENKYDNSVEISTKQGEKRENPLYFFLERYEKAYKDEVYEFISCLKDKKNPSVGINDSIEATVLALACMEAHKQKKAIKISDMKKQYNIN